MGLPRAERLKSRKAIQALFEHGHSTASYPLRIIWQIVPEPIGQASTQTAFAVPKKQFRKAVHRNRIKRQMREAFRLEKPRFFPQKLPEGSQMQLICLYIGREHPDFKALRKSFRRLLQQIDSTLEK